uniref:Peptidoglycan-recognition protein n=1 Tax=Strigamia maritima TaxID=126957 RepID=T1J1Y6_STRMM
MIRRREWGTFTLLPVKRKFENPAARIFIHQTATSPCRNLDHCKARVRQIQENDAIVLNHPDITFHFLIGGDGYVYEGLGWDTAGDHTSHYPFALGIAFIGQFERNRPSEIAWRALNNLIQCGTHHGKLQNLYSVHSHKDVSCTSCPGEALHKRLKGLKGYNRFPLPYMDMCRHRGK